MKKVTACIVMIGNEILSGKTQDKNLSWLSQNLNELGVFVSRAHVVADIESEIVEAVNDARAKYDYVFTTGGIGPTHDDITTEAICKAFGVKLVRHPEAERILREYYPPEKINDARLKMADIPLEAELIANPVSAAPAFRLENVFVLAGVPSIMQAMFLQVKDMIRGGAPMLSWQIELMRPEGDVANPLTAVQNEFPEAEIGCYPLLKNGQIGSTIVVRTHEADLLAKVQIAIMQMTNEF
jgi:molybdenum cofactor synthesis domain-containing protein